MASNIDPTKPETGQATTQSVRDNFQASKDEIEALQTDKLDTAGGTITGNLTVQGAFTSRGIDDNASKEVIEITDGAIGVGDGSSGEAYAIYMKSGVDDGTFILSGGSSAASGGRAVFRGSTHSSQPGDIELESSGNTFMRWDESAGVATFSTGSGAKTTALTIDASQNFNFSGYLTNYPGTPNDGDVLAWNAVNSRYEVTPQTGGGGGSVIVEDDGTQVLANASILNFTGPGVSVVDSGGGRAAINIPGGGGSGLAPGTVVNSVLRWDGADWVEETSFEVDVNGNIARFGTQNDVTIGNNVADTVVFSYPPPATNGALRFSVGASDGHQINSGTNFSIIDSQNGDAVFRHTKNGPSELYNNDVATFRTAALVNGGVEVNNTVTGAGWERVLTVSDIPGGGGGGPQTSGATVIDPEAGDSLTFFVTSGAITITGVSAHRQDGSSVTFNIGHGTNPSNPANSLWSADETVTANTTIDQTFAAFADATVPANNVIKLEISAVSGAVTEFHVTIEYTVD